MSNPLSDCVGGENSVNLAGTICTRTLRRELLAWSRRVYELEQEVGKLGKKRLLLSQDEQTMSL